MSRQKHDDTPRAELATQQWQRERSDLDPFPMQVCGRLAEAVQVMDSRHLNPLFARFDLRAGEFDVLATLRRAGEPYALTPTALYRAMMISSGGVTNRIDRLERARLIERRKNPQDRRGVLVQLTSAGVNKIDALLKSHVDNERRFLSGLCHAEQVELDRLLAKLIDSLADG